MERANRRLSSTAALASPNFPPWAGAYPRTRSTSGPCVQAALHDAKLPEVDRRVACLHRVAGLESDVSRSNPHLARVGPPALVDEDDPGVVQDFGLRLEVPEALVDLQRFWPPMGLLRPP